MFTTDRALTMLLVDRLLSECGYRFLHVKGRTNLHTHAVRSYAYACVLNLFALRAFVETFIAAYACVLKSLHPCVQIKAVILQFNPAEAAAVNSS
ncbi:hypothetical protein NQ318_009875 [Aromia moschata]|uniref:Uncharacterized protein n=1 Tax=Aromia moschata TaxID=1265417 RepID=A0AAV8Y2W1_9CUCU|nr:hypothetical protein NQ318_009875 [Aromia moschata]